MDRWTLTVTFDIKQDQPADLTAQGGECRLLIDYILGAWGISEETLSEIAAWNYHWLRVHSDMLDPIADVMAWVTLHTVPCTVNLQRNESR